MPKVIELKENHKTTFIEHLQDGRHFGVFFFFLVESFLEICGIVMVLSILQTDYLRAVQ